MFCTKDGKKNITQNEVAVEFSCICDFTKFCFQISTFISRKFKKYRVKLQYS